MVTHEMGFVGYTYYNDTHEMGFVAYVFLNEYHILLERWLSGVVDKAEK